MKTINATTKKGQQFINAYNRSTDYELRDCYGRFSCSKAVAENTCRRLMIAENGTGFKILSFNTFGFSCGWSTPYGLRVETRDNSYLIAEN